MIGLKKIDIYFLITFMSVKMLSPYCFLSSKAVTVPVFSSDQTTWKTSRSPQSETTPNDPEKYAMSNFFHYQDSRQTGNQQLGYAKIGMQ